MSNTPQRRQPFVLTATVDFPDDVGRGAYTPELLDELMATFAGIGVKRIHWLYYGDIDPDSYWAGSIFDWMDYGPQTLKAIGEPLAAAVPAAHRHGMEIVGVLKPYDLGASGTVPEGSPDPRATNLKQIGGTVLFGIPFQQQHRHTLIKRRPFEAPANLHHVAVRKIRLLKAGDSPTRLGKEHLEIWTSTDNYGYERRNVEFTVGEAVEPAPREVLDSFGRVLTTKGAPVRTLTLEGLSITDPYVLLTTNFKDRSADFRNTAVGMIEVYGDEPGPLPISVATRSGLWDSPRDFRSHGLEFDSGFGHYLCDLDVDNTWEKENIRWRSVSDDGVIAFARGKNETLPCAPCEAYPEVRKLWSGWVDRILATGVDGLALRLNSHGTFTDEPLEYGFNEPLVEEYRQRFGGDLLADGADLAKLAQLRGEHLTSFVHETHAKVRQAGKKMMVHAHPDGYAARPNSRQFFGISANVAFDWRSWFKDGLVDASVMRTSRLAAVPDASPGEARRAPLSHILAEPVADEALALAQETDVSMYYNGFVGLMGIDEYLGDLERIYRDERFAGFDLYESAGLLNPSDDGSRLEPQRDTLERVSAKLSELGVS